MIVWKWTSYVLLLLKSVVNNLTWSVQLITNLVTALVKLHTA